MSTWDKEQTLQLITLLEQYPQLYDTSAKHFLNKKKRNDALIAISQRLMKLRPGVTPYEIKSKIKTIRGQYIRQKNAIALSKKSGTDNDEDYQPSLWFYESLQFLDGFLTASTQNCNVSKISRTSQPQQRVPPQVAPKVTPQAAPRPPVALPKYNAGGDERFVNPAVERRISRSLQIAEQMADNVRQIMQTKDMRKRTPQYMLGKMVETELQDISEDLFLEAKWKIMDVIQETQKQHYFSKQNKLKTVPSTSTVNPIHLQSENEASSSEPTCSQNSFHFDTTMLSSTEYSLSGPNIEIVSSPTSFKPINPCSYNTKRLPTVTHGKPKILKLVAFNQNSTSSNVAATTRSSLEAEEFSDNSC